MNGNRAREHEVFHLRFSELFIDFFFEVFQLSFYFLIWRNFSGRRGNEGVGVLSWNEVDAPGLKMQFIVV